jgi:hypothetical protein
MKNKNPMIVSTDEEAFDKIQHPVIIVFKKKRNLQKIKYNTEL